MSTAGSIGIDLTKAKDIINSIAETSIRDKTVDKTVFANYLIPILQELQEAYGYLPMPVLEWVSRRTGIPTSRMHGVITFYSQFYIEPRGRHTIRSCQGTACHVKDGKRIAERVMELLDVEEGETTEDMQFTFETVACLGTCFLAPVIMVDDDYYGQITPDKI